MGLGLNRVNAVAILCIFLSELVTGVLVITNRKSLRTKEEGVSIDNIYAIYVEKIIK
jgi:hypothetical protein